MIINAQSSEAAVIAQINAMNTLPVTVDTDSVVFGTVTALTDGSGRVSVPVVANYDSEYEGGTVVNYKRLNLSQAYGGYRPTLSQIGYDSLHQMLPVINRYLGTKFDERDIIDVSLSWLQNNDRLNIQITAANNSLGYEGSFILIYIKIRPELDVVISTKALPVLAHPTDPTLGKNLHMAMWTLDFSGLDTTTLKLFYNEYWADHTSLAALMADLGFASWPQGTAGGQDFTSSLTSAIPEANQAFTNVIIQKNVTLAGYSGDAYFYYNRT
jgi:hypothetical protein